MTRIGLIATLVVGLAAVTLGAWLALPLWLPAVAGASMPPGFSLSEVSLTQRAWGLPVIRRAEVRGADCRLLLLEQLEVTLRWDTLVPHLDRVRAASVQVDPACRPLDGAKAGSRPSAALPVVPSGARLDIDRFTVAGWLPDPHRVALETAGPEARARLEGPSLDAEVAWDPVAGRGRVDVRRLRTAAGHTPVAGSIEAEGGIGLGPARAGDLRPLEGRVGLRLPGRVDLDVTITGTLDLARPDAPGIDLEARLTGAVPPAGARLDGELALAWRDGAVTVSVLRMGLDAAVAPSLVVLRPELRLARPVVLRRDDPRLRAEIGLTAARVDVVDAGKLEAPQADFRLDGDGSGVGWVLQATAGSDIGPLTGNGRLDGAGLSGRLRLADQALVPLQTLLPPTLPVSLEAGTATVDLALQWVFGATGPRLDGEGVVSKARLGTTHARVEGIDARAAFGFAGGTWRIARERPATLAVEWIEAAVPAQAGRARLTGAWPYSPRDPLRVEDLRVGCLGGEISLDALSLPATGKAVTLALRGIRLEQISALYGDRTVTLGGTLDGDLPLRRGPDGWTVEGGALRNTAPVRVRLSDAEALSAFKQANPGLADAADWLSDLEVGRLDATLDLQADGTLVLVATIEGHNPQRGDRPVRLNYRHEENLYQLLQSLRIGSDLGRDIEQRLSPPQRSRQ